MGWGEGEGEGRQQTTCVWKLESRASLAAGAGMGGWEGAGERGISPSTAILEAANMLYRMH